MVLQDEHFLLIQGHMLHESPHLKCLPDGNVPQMPHRLNKMNASDCHAVLKKKSVLYSTYTRQSFCTFSHKNRIRNALHLYQTFIHRKKATSRGPTDVYELT